MRARIYLPGIGRFTQVDPVEGGVENNYIYPTDPVNEFDLDGNMSMSGLRSMPNMRIMTDTNGACRNNMSACETLSFFAPIPGLGLVKGAKVGLWASKSSNIKKSKLVLDNVKRIRVSVQLHPAHHFWGTGKDKMWYKHIELRAYTKGKHNSTKKIQIRYGRGCPRKNCQ